MNEDRQPTDPRSAAVSFVTTEHFTLQGARASTVASFGSPGSFVGSTTPRSRSIQISGDQTMSGAHPGDENWDQYTESDLLAEPEGQAKIDRGSRSPSPEARRTVCTCSSDGRVAESWPQLRL